MENTKNELFLALSLVKEKLRKYKVISLVLFVILASIGFQHSYPRGDYVAKIYIEGEIFEDHYRANIIEKMANDKNIKGIIVFINSPGGTAFGGEQLYKALKYVSSKKPVVSVIGTMGASSAYMASLASENIFAGETSETGSIGVLQVGFNIVDLAKKIGIEPQIFKTSEFKANPNPFERLTDKGIKEIQNSLNDSLEVFIDIVVENRKNLSREKVVALSDGRTFTGRQAVKNGLIDAIGGEREAISWLKDNKSLDKNIRIEDYTIESESNKIRDIFMGLSKFKSLLKFLYSI